MTDLPVGEYAIVEVLGHRTLIGRITEVERFGVKLMSIEPIYQDALLPAVMIGGGGIYQFTPCTVDVAATKAPKSLWQLPSSIAVTLPPELLTEAKEADDRFRPQFLDLDDDDEPQF